MSNDKITAKNLANAYQELAELDKKREKLLQKIQSLENSISQNKLSEKQIKKSFTPEQKISIFRSLFKGRQDVYAKRFESKKTGKSGYQPACANEWKFGLCSKPKVKCTNCQKRNFLPFDDLTARCHLIGKDDSDKPFTCGIYPLLDDETCWFLAVDFDKTSWKEDVNAFLRTCSEKDVPAALERSRSGNGGHVWIFFAESVSAITARQMGSYLLTETMEKYPDIDFESYDRLLPNQDTIPKGGFGNLIALPLQGEPRKAGNSVFVDDKFVPYEDQWGFLVSVRKMSLNTVLYLADQAMQKGRITGVKMVVEDEMLPWEQPASRSYYPDLTCKLPENLNLVLENQIYIAKENLPAQLKTRLIRIAAFQNPEFYRAQAMRLPVYSKPRIISCVEDYKEHIGIPRGCLDEVCDFLESNNIKYSIDDKRNSGTALKCRFQGTLRIEQKKAVKKLFSHDIGVLSASTAFGKTVVALSMISKRKTNTLILVHRTQLIEQWKARISSFLNITEDEIGIIGGGKKKPKGKIDIATIQSLCKKRVVDDVVGDYGMVIVDECHHLSAVSFELVARQCKAKYFLGLSATLTRKDGHHPIIFMQCGQIRYKVNDLKEAAKRPFHHRVIIRNTDLSLDKNEDDITINEIYDVLSHDELRNMTIVKDVISALKEKRSPVVITERKEHLDYFENYFCGKVKNVFVLKGGMRKKQRDEVYEKLQTLPENEERLILTTGKYLGEGFDDARLDTLFLTLPVSWKGTLAQYAGRLHRLHDSKQKVLIYDYVDSNIAIPARMFKRRCLGYKAIGYEIEYPEQPRLL